MKLTTKNLLIVLVVLGTAYGVTQLTKRSGRSKTLKSTLVTIDTADVSKIEITSPGNSLELVEETGEWKVSLPGGSQKAAKKSSVVSLLNSLNTIKPGRLAAKSQEKWKDYTVDSTGTRVKVYENGEVSTDIVIGRFGMEGQQRFYTFVRLFQDEEVYVANDFMGMSVGKDAASYRENKVLQLKKDSLVSIAFNYPDSAFKLMKGEKWYLEDQEADSASVVSYLNGLAFVNSRTFFDDEISVNASHRIVFEFSDQPEIVIDAYFVNDEVILNSSENTAEYFMEDALTDKILKSRSAFMPTSN